jgi:CHASE3 domain sensor protein
LREHIITTKYFTRLKKERICTRFILLFLVIVLILLFVVGAFVLEKYLTRRNNNR